MKSTISIPTGFYADETERILKALHKSMEKSYQVQSNFRLYGLLALSFERAVDNEILLKLDIGDGYGRAARFWKRIVQKSFYYNDNKVEPAEAKAVLEKFGWNIKNLARGFAIKDMEINAKGTDGIDSNYEDFHAWKARSDKYFKKHVWHRDGGLNVKNYLAPGVVEDFDLKGVTLTIGDIYFIYEKLVGRLEKSTKRYDSAVVRRLIGEPRDPVSTEAEQARRDEVARITEEYAAKIDARTPIYNYSNSSPAYYELQNLIDDFKAKCKAECEALRRERDAKIAEVNAVCNLMTV